MVNHFGIICEGSNWSLGEGERWLRNHSCISEGGHSHGSKHTLLDHFINYLIIILTIGVLGFWGFTYTAIFCLLGLFVPRRAIPVGLIYAVVVEGLLSVVPAVVNELTASYYIGPNDRIWSGNGGQKVRLYHRNQRSQFLPYQRSAYDRDDRS